MEEIDKSDRLPLDRRPALLMIASGVEGTVAENHLGQATTLDELRDYQQELLEQAESALQSPKARVILQLPTGGGKTHIAGALLARMLEDGRKAVWLTHRTELAEQTRGMLTDAGVWAIKDLQWHVGDKAPYLSNGAVILMAQTVSRRTSKRQIWDSYVSDDMLVIDEAHHASATGWERAINQWPGRVLGLTATPWRLSKTEGFDHLFGELHCGPQVHELQSDGWLCTAQMLMPPAEDIIRGGNITGTGDFNELGILGANRDHPDVMTAGALRFWQAHAAGRQTVIYAISKDHARNLTAVFNAAEIPTAIMLDDTPRQERAMAIESFRNGTLRVLVNVDIATEGFDLPDASCVVITRPTMSLALYLQMVGRGLRPKSDDRKCLILDLAGNAKTHGLPEEIREWSLYARGSNSTGTAPVVWCEKCDRVSPAANHFCKHCDSPLGNNCGRCRKWRATRRWGLADQCTLDHEVVCDLCHLDAHVAANLPESRELREVAIDPLLFALVDEVRKHLLGDSSREKELNELIAQRERESSSNADLEHLFDAYISDLSIEKQSTSNFEIGMLFNDGKTQMQEELVRWNEELTDLKSKTAIEYKVLRGCEDQLEQAGNRRIFQGLKADELRGNIEELVKRKHRYFLFIILHEEEMERIQWKSRSDELDIIAKWQAKTDSKEDNHRVTQLSKDLEKSIDRRLQTMRRQFERLWPEIWAECQQFPE